MSADRDNQAYTPQEMIINTVSTFLDTHPDLESGSPLLPLKFGPVEGLNGLRLSQEVTIGGVVYLVSVRPK